MHLTGRAAEEIAKRAVHAAAARAESDDRTTPLSVAARARLPLTPSRLPRLCGWPTSGRCCAACSDEANRNQDARVEPNGHAATGRIDGRPVFAALATVAAEPGDR